MWIYHTYINRGASESEFGDRFSKKRKSLKELNIYNGMDYSIINEYVRVLKKINMFIWCSRLQILDILNIMSEHQCSYDILTWNKSNPQPSCNNTWLQDIEYCLYFREKGVPLNDGYELKSKWYNSPLNKRDKDKFEHPTIKPIELVERHLLHTTQPNDVVLDTFLGSGTTAVACKNIGRYYIGFEISEKYFKIAQDRLNKVDANGQLSMFNM